MYSIDRRKLLTTALLTPLAGAMPAFANTYPSQPIKILCGSAAGGPTDLAARLAARWLSERLGQPAIVDNRVGANSQVAIQLLMQSKPDGYTLAAIPRGALTIAPSLQKAPRYDPLKDFTPLAIVGQFPYVLVARNSFPANDAAGLIEYAKRNPGKVTFGSAGIGSTNHLAGEWFANAAGVSMIHVPYKGDAPGSADVIAGLIDVYFMTAGNAMPQVQAKKIKLLGVASNAPSDLAGGSKTLVSSAVPGFEIGSWIGLLGPANMPADLVKRINGVINEEAEKPEGKPALLAIGQEAVIAAPDRFKTMMEEDMKRFTALGRQAKIEVD
ncbi:Bug family tripartite tricarboxylate transporter substrate binding protein [Hydrogenophaga palleronii]|uniref:Bug family tripartite tricarboxylate transporter substrate binding protein n=1 Tax=Hydrogenophaga palleronii TaxID=65655 RepID=UPI0008271B84|nr:tripartite tricarboxylate transporter substrate binding protein [Hydrogenophaga palleronii]